MFSFISEWLIVIGLLIYSVVTMIFYVYYGQKSSIFVLEESPGIVFDKCMLLKHCWLIRLFHHCQWEHILRSKDLELICRRPKILSVYLACRIITCVRKIFREGISAVSKTLICEFICHEMTPVHILYCNWKSDSWSLAW